MSKQIFTPNPEFAKDALVPSMDAYYALRDKANNDYDGFVRDMESLSVRYIMLSKSEDFQRYTWLDDIDDLIRIQDNKYLIIYEINK